MSCYYAPKFRRQGISGTLRLDTNTYYDSELDPVDASCSLTLSSAGFATITGTGGDSYQWLTGADPADYEVRATVTSGTFTSGTTGSWLALSSNRTWNVFRAVIGTKSCTATFEIRKAAGPGTILISASITLEAIVDA